MGIRRGGGGGGGWEPVPEAGTSVSRPSCSFSALDVEKRLLKGK